MRPYRLYLCWLTALLTAAASGCSAPPTVSSTATLERFNRRVELVRLQLPTIIAAAEAAAARKAEHPKALIDLPYNEQPAFGEDMLNRSGGLAGALPSNERSSLMTNHDIVLLSVRSWQSNGEHILKYLRRSRKRGNMTILIASTAGKPDNLDTDFFIDNGAADGSEDEATINLFSNVLIGWLWVCEYSSALTRHGKHPGILQSITTPGSHAHNRVFQNRRTRHYIYPCETAVPAEDLAHVYLARVDRMIDDLHGERTRRQISAAADIIADRLESGRPVFVSTSTHIMLNDLGKNVKVPWTPLNTLRRMPAALAEHTKPGDLFFWLGFNGASIWWYPGSGPKKLYIDYDRYLRKAKVDLITCFATDPFNPRNNGGQVLAHIEQNWNFGDAVVPVPFPPNRIAPISGLYQGLLYRMVEDTVARRLESR